MNEVHVNIGTECPGVPFICFSSTWTGCDTGFGHALARRISDLGVTVFAGVLDETSPGAVELKRLESEGLQVLQLDVTDAAQIERAHHYICTQVGEAGNVLFTTRTIRRWGHIRCISTKDLPQFWAQKADFSVSIYACQHPCLTGPWLRQPDSDVEPRQCLLCGQFIRYTTQLTKMVQSYRQ